MRIVIATDAWAPQVNGVVNSLRNTRNELRKMGHEVLMITPEGALTFPMSHLSGNSPRTLPGPSNSQNDRGVRSGQHSYCDRGHYRARRSSRLPQSRSSIHNRLPHAVPGVRQGTGPHSYPLHRGALEMVSSCRCENHGTDARDQDSARGKGFQRTSYSGHAASIPDFFLPTARSTTICRARYGYTWAGVSVEKNIDAFVGLDLPGTKVIIGRRAGQGKACRRASRVPVCRLQVRRRTRVSYRWWRCLRVSEPDRHFLAW